MHERKFVMVPLCEIAPEVIHPKFGKDMKSLLKECRDKGMVKKKRGFYNNPLSAKL
jgi:2-amino-4-hydroxy-6-hydroxymethyldihydropteridine diphosphokinase